VVAVGIWRGRQWNRQRNRSVTGAKTDSPSLNCSVIVVLGILAAVVVFTIGSVTSKSAQSACAADAKSVENAVASSNAQNGTPIALESASNSSTQANKLVGVSMNAWPSNSTHYKLALAYSGNCVGATAGQVLVYAPASSTTPVVYDAQTTLNGCNTSNISLDRKTFTPRQSRPTQPWCSPVTHTP
jgi:type II secretory pathway pseudopilin PulG